MAFKHGKDTYVSVNGTDLSAYTNTSDLNRTGDSHDVTTYGKDAHVFGEGLTNGTLSMGGTYDTTAGTGPRAVLRPLVGAAPTTVVRRPEGTGSGLPQDSFDGLLTSYTESNPVADYISWQATFQISDVVDSTAQA